MTLLSQVLSATGALTLTYFSYKVVESTVSALRASGLPKYLHCQDGSWALVTGASDGIGKAFAAELLARGFNVIIHGRNKEKLDKYARELRATYNKRKVEVLVADATDVTTDFSLIRRQMERLDGKLTVLVNNVGGIQAQRSYQVLEKMPAKDILNCININVSFTTLLTSALLPVLKANGPSLILNCSSLGSLMQPPYISVYVGTKGYIDAWSGSLRAENIDTNVEVLALAIGNTTTTGNKTHEANITISAQECAKGCLDQVGCGNDIASPHWRHSMSALPLYILPTAFIKKQMVPIVKRRYDEEELASAAKTL